MVESKMVTISTYPIYSDTSPINQIQLAYRKQFGTRSKKNADKDDTGNRQENNTTRLTTTD